MNPGLVETLVWIVSSAFRIAGVGAVICLDRTAWGQLMISRPLVAGTLTGAACGSAATGLLTGAALELLWLTELPVGSTIPTDDTMLTVLAAGLAATITARQPNPDPETTATLVFLLVIAAILLAPLSRRLDDAVRHRNRQLITDAETLLLAAAPHRAAAVHLRGLLHFWGYAFAALLGAGVVALAILPPLFTAIPTGIHALGPPLLTTVMLAGTASLLSGMHQRHAVAVFAGTALLTSLVWL
ncbi:MAG: PTS sugar transporter subunit IIC [Deltaproteobacteria bacterium]|nr:PTS sugar transporter subunit IIC [Candidatus Anaeroferrophillacea bacterium]